MKTHTAILNAALVACLTMTGASLVWAGDTSPLAALDPDNIEGKAVLDKSGQQVGDVNEVVHGKSGQKLAVIGLEESMKEVAIPLDKLEWTAEGDKFVTMLDRSELEAMPDYDLTDLPSVDE